jgi:hypothetical protein
MIDKDFIKFFEMIIWNVGEVTQGRDTDPLAGINNRGYFMDLQMVDTL